MEKWRTIVFPFSILFFFFLLDGVLTNFFNEQLQFNLGYVDPRLTFICFVIFAFHLKGTNLFLQGLLLGFLFDSYFSGILGVYMASFSLISYMTVHLRNYFYPGWVSYIFIGTLMILFNEFFVFSVYNVIDLADYTFSQFWGNHIGATFIGNFICLMILIPLLRKIAIYVSE